MKAETVCFTIPNLFIEISGTCISRSQASHLIKINYFRRANTYSFFHVEHILLHLWKTKYLFRSPERLFWNFCPLKILDYKIKPDMAVVITSAEDELYDWELMCALTFYYDLWNEIINGAQATVAQLYDSYCPLPSLCVFIHTFLAQGF